ncbi:MAG: bifunctional ADP-heptose synthase [Candidatus Goldbacteria bacterium]|nr:bifunctional ADP-heptose synthase [Candidatus Goldiibacteriota bacterium]
MEKYLNLINRFKEKKILVLGDFILDEYVYGETERISREAPVLILKYNHSTYLAGGGANPVMNIKDLGAIPIAISVCGYDVHSKIMLNLLKSKKINLDTIIRDKNFNVPVKTRIMAGSVHTVKQQIVRIDRVGAKSISKETENTIINNLKEFIKKTDCLLVSDYGGPLLTDKIISIISNYAKEGYKVVVDSRYALKKFKYITTGTPNETEAGPLVDIESYEEKDVEVIIKKLTNLIKAKGMVVTRGSKGMMIYENKKIIKIPAFGSEEIVDVSGAGDTVASIISLALACGSSLKDAAYLANIGGGLVVMKRGVATVTSDELKKALKNA